MLVFIYTLKLDIHMKMNNRQDECIRTARALKYAIRSAQREHRKEDANVLRILYKSAVEEMKKGKLS